MWERGLHMVLRRCFALCCTDECKRMHAAGSRLAGLEVGSEAGVLMLHLCVASLRDTL